MEVKRSTSRKQSIPIGFYIGNPILMFILTSNDPVTFYVRSKGQVSIITDFWTQTLILKFVLSDGQTKDVWVWFTPLGYIRCNGLLLLFLDLRLKKFLMGASQVTPI